MFRWMYSTLLSIGIIVYIYFDHKKFVFVMYHAQSIRRVIELRCLHKSNQ